MDDAFWTTLEPLAHSTTDELSHAQQADLTVHDYDKFVSGERTLRSKLVPKRGVTSSDIPDALDSQNTDFAQSAYGVFSIGHENVKPATLANARQSAMTMRRLRSSSIDVLTSVWHHEEQAVASAHTAPQEAHSLFTEAMPDYAAVQPDCTDATGAATGDSHTNICLPAAAVTGQIQHVLAPPRITVTRPGPQAHLAQYGSGYPSYAQGRLPGVTSHSQCYPGCGAVDSRSLKRPASDFDASGNPVMHVSRRIGMYGLHDRVERLKRWQHKRQRRVWSKRINYSCRRRVAKTRPRINGRFVTPEEYSKHVVEHGEPLDGSMDITTSDMPSASQPPPHPYHHHQHMTVSADSTPTNYAMNNAASTMPSHAVRPGVTANVETTSSSASSAPHPLPQSQLSRHAAAAAPPSQVSQTYPGVPSSQISVSARGLPGAVQPPVRAGTSEAWRAVEAMAAARQRGVEDSDSHVSGESSGDGGIEGASVATEVSSSAGSVHHRTSTAADPEYAGGAGRSGWPQQQ